MEIKAIKIGDKFVVTKKVASFLDKDDIIEIVDVNEDGIISFAFGEGFIHKGMMSYSDCEEHFAKIEEKTAPTVTSEMVDEILEDSDIEVQTVFDKCTVVSCRLPNGFVIVESSACVSPENYNEEMGIDICLERIKSKIWELEGYRLQMEMLEDIVSENECCCGYCDECDGCDDEDYDYDEFDDEFDECLDTDLDCDDCDDYDCPFNSNNR